MNEYNLIYKGSSGNVNIIDSNISYLLQPYKITKIKNPIGVYYTINQKDNVKESLIIQTKHCYYSIIFDHSMLAAAQNYSYYFLYLNHLLDINSAYQPNVYGVSMVEKTDIQNIVLSTISPQLFTNISLTTTVSKQPVRKSSTYTSSNHNSFLTLFKNNNTLFASYSVKNGPNYTSFCGSYESSMEQFLLYNSDDILIHNTCSLEYNDLYNPVNLTINL